MPPVTVEGVVTLSVTRRSQPYARSPVRRSIVSVRGFVAVDPSEFPHPDLIGTLAAGRMAGRPHYLVHLPRSRKWPADLYGCDGHRVAVTAYLRPWGNRLGADAMRASLRCCDEDEHTMAALAGAPLGLPEPRRTRLWR